MWDNLADISQNIAAKIRSKTGCYALQGEPKVEKLLYLHKNLAVCDHGHKSKQKLTKTVCFHPYTSGTYVCPPLDWFNLSRDSSCDADSILL